MDNPLVKLISRIVDEKLYKYNRTTPSFWVGKVVPSSGSVAQNAVASVYLNGDPTSTPINIKNKSNETLVANSEVYIMSMTGSLSNSIILIKK